MQQIKPILALVFSVFCISSAIADTYSECDIIVPGGMDTEEYRNNRSYYNCFYKIIIDEEQKIIQFLHQETDDIIATFRIKSQKRGDKNQTIFTAANKETGRLITIEIKLMAGSSPEFYLKVSPIKNVSNFFRGETAIFHCCFESYDD